MKLKRIKRIEVNGIDEKNFDAVIRACHDGKTITAVLFNGKRQIIKIKNVIFRGEYMYYLPS